ncbi:MAG TPA: metal ABC transporter ATP-binding protein [Methanolinea sp.]|nr:metal ABC transporter ATP-binding protein [Methanolinea sp.]
MTRTGDSRMRPVIEVSDVSFGHNGKVILEHVSLKVRKGDFFALIGPNGGGKTTLLKIILGLLVPSGGTVTVLGQPPGRARSRVGYVPQFRTYDFSYPITVREMVLSGRLSHARFPWARYTPADHEAADRILERLRMAPLAERPVSALSGGEQQRAILARALVGNPEVLILDEPTVYIDAPTEVHFYNILEDLRKDLTVLLVSHDIGVISRHVTRVACLNRRLFTHDSPEITEDMIEAAYQCPVDLIAHGIPHRVLGDHPGEGGSR